MEGFVEFGRPIVALGFGGVFALLVGEVGSDQVHLDERPEHPVRSPLNVVRCHH